MTPRQVGSLLEDLTVYPRHAVDDGHVASLVNALKAGANLPPIVVEAGTLRIVDGFHRSRAYRRVLGAEGVVDVEENVYADEQALLIDAVRRNAAHGRKLDVIDQVRAIALGREKGISLITMGLVLNLPEERAQKLSVRLASVETTGPGVVTGTLSVALKRPAQHLTGMMLTEAQAKAHESAPGTSYLLLVRQLIEAMTASLLNQADDRLMDGLRDLHSTLGEFLTTA